MGACIFLTANAPHLPMTRLAPGDGMNKGGQLLTLRAVNVALDKIAPGRGTDVRGLRWINRVRYRIRELRPR